MGQQHRDRPRLIVPAQSVASNMPSRTSSTALAHVLRWCVIACLVVASRSAEQPTTTSVTAGVYNRTTDLQTTPAVSTGAVTASTGSEDDGGGSDASDPEEGDETEEDEQTSDEADVQRGTTGTATAAARGSQLHGSTASSATASSAAPSVASTAAVTGATGSTGATSASDEDEDRPLAKIAANISQVGDRAGRSLHPRNAARPPLTLPTTTTSANKVRSAIAQ